MSEPCQHQLKRCRHCSSEYCVKCGIVPKNDRPHSHVVDQKGSVKHG